MNWLYQNWIWIVLVIGGFFLMARLGGMGRYGAGRSAGHRHGTSNDNPPAARGPGPDTAFDPVSRHVLASGGDAISSVYRGRAYYFESRENRDAFESNPEKYLAGTASAGEIIEADRRVERRGRRRHGC